MTFFIDAWLDRSNPYLRIIDKQSGNVCVELDEQQLQLLQQRGEVDLHALETNESSQLKELLHGLFLFCFAQQHCS